MTLQSMQNSVTLRNYAACLVILACCGASAASSADRGRDNSAATAWGSAPGYTKNYNPTATTGPVTSLANAYGPVPAFGLRNYSRNGDSEFHYRRSGRGTAFGGQRQYPGTQQRRVLQYRNAFGFTYSPPSE